MALGMVTTETAVPKMRARAAAFLPASIGPRARSSPVYSMCESGVVG
jgi:hypothetical protein